MLRDAFRSEICFEKGKIRKNAAIFYHRSAKFVSSHYSQLYKLMKLPVSLTLCLFLLCSSFSLWGQNVPADICYTPEEKALYDAIDAFRKEAQQTTIPYSKTLSYVAKLHAQDLFENRKDSEQCSMHSWSDKGFWTACCHNDTPEKSACMWEKPREVAGYDGLGYELIYNGGGNADKIMDRWKNSKFFADMLVHGGKWADKDWVAIGIGKYENYVVVWFGEVLDPLGSPKACQGKSQQLSLTGGKKAETTTASNNAEVDSDVQGSTAARSGKKFYLVYGSYETEENAQKALSQLHAKGFSQAKILPMGENGRYRIAVSEHSTKDEARKAQDDLDFSYVGAWVLEQ
jgi:hypothetical protein